uniref:Probable DNA polymerase n=1 Tax=Stropharia rugosoannulata TaxID=68746 RepID=A0A3G9GXR9_9AGAR|nr:hypothetical protein [Stropharia rugosoannulata]
MVIKPLKSKKFYDKESLKGFNAMDVENLTLPNHDGLQLPVVISLCGPSISKLFIIESNRLDCAIKKGDVNLIDHLVTGLWLDFFYYLENNPLPDTIFAHNLGGFDGLFLYKALLKSRDKDNVKAIIDNKNKFISITYQTPCGIKYVWKDSYRVFPISLSDLCETFGVDGKIGEYKDEYNDISVFSKDNSLKNFLDYALQDAKALYEALHKAQNIYYDQYHVDVTTIFSTSTLSLKIFRQGFLKTDIPIMSRSED